MKWYDKRNDMGGTHRAKQETAIWNHRSSAFGCYGDQRTGRQNQFHPESFHKPDFAPPESHPNDLFFSGYRAEHTLFGAGDCCSVWKTCACPSKRHCGSKKCLRDLRPSRRIESIFDGWPPACTPDDDAGTCAWSGRVSLRTCWRCRQQGECPAFWNIAAIRSLFDGGTDSVDRK